MVVPSVPSTAAREAAEESPLSRRRAKSSPFTMLPKFLTRSKAWRSLNGDCRALYLELRERFNGHNNGSIALGNREAGEAINTGKDTARRCFDVLIERGFIVVTADSTFNQKRLSREWRLTELPDDRTGHKASKEFASWGFEKQNAGAPVRHIGASVRHETEISERIADHRRAGAPVSTEAPPSQAHGCATSRFTTSPERKNGTR
jgi:hypothetical protein